MKRLAALATLLLAGCASKVEHPKADAAWFEPVTSPLPPCSDPEPIGGELTVHLVRDRSLTDASLARVVGELAGYWEGQGLTLRPGTVRVVDLPGLFEPPLDPRPLRSFLDTHARPPGDGVLVVLVPRLWPAGVRLPPAAGLAVTAGGHADVAGPEVQQALGEAPATPTAFVSWDGFIHSDPARVFRGAAAHEVGHLLGLPHVDGEGDLMGAPGACVPSLDAEQRATVRASLSRRR